MSLRRLTVARTVSCYKPFMWCRPDARLRYYYSCSFPLEESFRPSFGTQYIILGFREDYRPTSLLFSVQYYLYVWVHLLIYSHASCLHLVYLIFELSCEYFHSTHPCTACSYYLYMRATQTFVADVVIIIISEYDCPLLCYTRVLNVCEYIQTYSLACPWLLSWPDSLLGDKHCEDSPGTYALTIAASRR